MARGNGSVIVVAISWFYVFASFYKLWRHRLYRRFFSALAVFSILGLFIYEGFCWSLSFESDNLRVWTVAPLMFLALGYLLSGFFLRKYVETSVQRSRASIVVGGVSASGRVRSIGAALSLTGIGIWIYGIAYPIAGSAYIVALVFALCLMALGFPSALTGKKIGDIDHDAD